MPTVSTWFSKLRSSALAAALICIAAGGANAQQVLREPLETGESFPGTTFSLQSDHQEYRVGDDPKLTITLKNVSSREVTFLTHRQPVVDVKIVVNDGQANIALNHDRLHPGILDSRAFTLGPGESLPSTVALSSWGYVLSPGSYTIYGMRYPNTPAGIGLRSNSIHIVVR